MSLWTRLFGWLRARDPVTIRKQDPRLVPCRSRSDDEFGGTVEEEVTKEQIKMWGTGSRLGGDRHAAHGLDQNGDLVHMDVCIDCLLFLANGDEPSDWRAE